MNLAKIEAAAAARDILIASGKFYYLSQEVSSIMLIT